MKKNSTISKQKNFSHYLFYHLLKVAGAFVCGEYFEDRLKTLEGLNKGDE